MMFHYTLTRSFGHDDDQSITSTTVSERDPINAAAILAAVFNSVNRPMMHGFARVCGIPEGNYLYDGI